MKTSILLSSLYLSALLALPPSASATDPMCSDRSYREAIIYDLNRLTKALESSKDESKIVFNAYQLSSARPWAESIANISNYCIDHAEQHSLAAKMRSMKFYADSFVEHSQAFTRATIEVVGDLRNYYNKVDGLDDNDFLGGLGALAGLLLTKNQREAQLEAIRRDLYDAYSGMWNTINN